MTSVFLRASTIGAGILVLGLQACSSSGGPDQTSTTLVSPTSTTSLATTTVPQTTTSTMITTPPSSEVMKLFEGAVVKLRGYGPLRIGATIDELQNEYGIVLAEDECPALLRIVGGPSNLWVTLNQGGRIGRIEVHEPLDDPTHPTNSNPILDVTTLSGVSLGSSEQEVIATYGSQVVLETIPGDDVTPSGERRLTFVPRDDIDAHLRLIFGLDEGRVTNMRTGEEAAVQRFGICD